MSRAFSQSQPLPHLGTQGYPPRLGYQEVLFHLTTIKKLKQW